MATDAQTLITAAIQAGYGRLSDRELKEAILAAASSSGGGGAVSQIIAGAGISVSPAGGTGAVTVSAVSPFKVTTAYPLTDGTPAEFTFAHGLGSVPSYVNLVLVCTTNDAVSGLTVGQVIDAETCDAGAAGPYMEFIARRDATNIYLIYAGDNGSDVNIPVASGGGNAFTSFSNFSLKAYYAK
jgi:hypothetical protein